MSAVSRNSLRSFNGVCGRGERGMEALCAPMRNVPKDQSALRKLLTRETALVSLAQRPFSNESVGWELNQLVPHLKSKKRNHINRHHINIPEYFKDDKALKELFADRTNMLTHGVNNLNFPALIEDIQKMIERLSSIMDFSKPGIFGLRHVAPGMPPGGWHFDSEINEGFFRAVRGLTVSGMDVSLRGDFRTVSQEGRVFEVHKYSPTGIGLNVFNKHPDDGCPLHRIAAGDKREHRWGYVIDGVRRNAELAAFTF